MGPKVISINGAQVISAKIRIHLDVSRHTKGKSGFDVEKCSKEVTKLELALQKPRAWLATVEKSLTVALFNSYLDYL